MAGVKIKVNEEGETESVDHVKLQKVSLTPSCINGRHLISVMMGVETGREQDSISVHQVPLLRDRQESSRMKEWEARTVQELRQGKIMTAESS